MNLIGMSVDGARELLSSEGYEVVIKDNTSDKVTSYDACLVTNATFDGKVCYLVVSKFKLGIDE